MADRTRPSPQTSRHADPLRSFGNRDGCVTYGKGVRMLTLDELCEWLNITERHARKLVERDAIPYRKVGHLLRFPEAEIEEWSHPARRTRLRRAESQRDAFRPAPKHGITRSILPKSLIE
jgi:excisionase family DNA binding protein